MKIDFKYSGNDPLKLKTFIKNQGISRHLMAKVRNNGGQLLINGSENRKVDKINPNTVVSIVFPPEKNRKNELIPSFIPLDIMYEDRDFLIVNKPAHVNSIPSIPQKKDSMVNRVYGYYKLRGYDDIIPHVVTRLDRDTSGIILFAKHRYATAILTQQLTSRSIKKTYLAILSGHLAEDHLMINEPIGRFPGSLIKRQVTSDGRKAQTEVWVKQEFANSTLAKIQLHTGRTHQIRVHCSYLGHPLVGDTLYGGKVAMPLQRQGLHCSEIEFYHPFKKKMMHFKASFPKDMQKYLELG